MSHSCAVAMRDSVDLTSNCFDEPGESSQFDIATLSALPRNALHNTSSVQYEYTSWKGVHLIASQFYWPMVLQKVRNDDVDEILDSSQNNYSSFPRRGIPGLLGVHLLNTTALLRSMLQ